MSGLTVAGSLAKVKRGCGCKGATHDKDCCNSIHYKAKSGFSAANSDSIYTGGIPDLLTAEETFTQEHRQNLNAIAQYLYRNNGAAFGLVEMAVQHLSATWTPNPTPIIKLLDGWTPEEVDEWNANQICFYRDYLDGTNYISASEDKNFTGLIQQQVRNTKILGEITATVEFLDPRTPEHAHRELGTAINVFEPNRIYTPWDYVPSTSVNAARVIDGIKKNRYRRTLGAYIHSKPYEDCNFYTDYGKTPSLTPTYGRNELSHRKQFIHCFQDKELGFCRGVSSFAASAEYLVMQMQTLRNITMRAQRQNETTGVYSSKNGMATADSIAPNLGLGRRPEDDEWSRDPNLKQYADCSPKQKDIMWRLFHYKNTNVKSQTSNIGDIFLPAGDEYTQISHDNGTLAATELFNSINHAVAATHSTGKSQLTKEYDGNYTAMRASRLDNAQALAMDKNCSDEYADSIYKPAAEEAVEKGILPFPESIVRRFNLTTPERRHKYFVKYMRPLTAMQWNKPQDRLIDPEKDAKGHAELYDNGLTTKSKSIAEIHGISYDEFLEQKAAERKKQIKHEIDCELAENEMRAAAALPPKSVDPDNETEEDETEE